MTKFEVLIIYLGNAYAGEVTALTSQEAKDKVVAVYGFEPYEFTLREIGTMKKSMSNMQKVSLILDVAHELGIDIEFDDLMTLGMRFIHDEFTAEENREVLIANL